jgi:hypothetical protein
MTRHEDLFAYNRCEIDRHIFGVDQADIIWLEGILALFPRTTKRSEIDVMIMLIRMHPRMEYIKEHLNTIIQCDDLDTKVKRRKKRNILEIPIENLT